MPRASSLENTTLDPTIPMVFPKPGGYDIRREHLLRVSSSSDSKDTLSGDTSNDGIGFLTKDLVSHIQKNGDEKVRMKDLSQVSFIGAPRWMSLY